METRPEEQKRFPFMRLPVDIRLLVYEELVPPGTPFYLGASRGLDWEHFKRLRTDERRRVGIQALSLLGKSCSSL